MSGILRKLKPNTNCSSMNTHAVHGVTAEKILRKSTYLITLSCTITFHAQYTNNILKTCPKTKKKTIF